MLFTGIGRSVFGETVPEVLSTSRWMTYIYSTFITQEKAKQRQKKSNIYLTHSLWLVQEKVIFNTLVTSLENISLHEDMSKFYSKPLNWEIIYLTTA